MNESNPAIARTVRCLLAILSVFIVSITTVTAQQTSLSPSIPTSPQAEAIQRYGDFTVDNFTGTANISIPLYEINHRGYRIPITLNYFPTPLKPFYNYDVFGHGWGLSMNSVVSRSIEYLPDELRDFKIETQTFTEYLRTFAEGERSSYLSEYNYAHDKFKAVLPDGSSFSFIIDNVDGQLVYTVSDGRNVKISTGITSTEISSFTIIDENGIKYTFSEGDRPISGAAYSANVSWQLGRIDLPYSDEPITFAYNYSIQSAHPYACVEPGVKISAWSYPDSPDDQPRYFSMSQEYPTTASCSYKMKLLSSVNYGTTQIQLDYQDESASANYNYINTIKILNGSLLREINFDMTVHNTNGHCAVGSLAKLNGITIKGKDASDAPLVYECVYTNSNFAFQGTDHWGYLNDMGTNYAPANFNMYVGLFRGSGPYNQISFLTKSPLDPCPYEKIKLSPHFLTMDIREPSEPSRHGVLSRLSYPTGGYTAFEFENHKFLTSSDPYSGDYIQEPENRRTARAGGFRIRKITNYIAEGAVANIKSYRYGKALAADPYEHTGLGEAVVDPTIFSYMDKTFKHGSGMHTVIPINEMILGLPYQGSYLNESDFEWNNDSWRWDCVFSASNFRRLLDGRPAVVYPEVTVYDGDIGENNIYTPEKTNGKTVYKYDVYEAIYADGKTFEVFFELQHYFGNTLSYFSNSARYNKLMEKSDYKFDGQGYKIVQREKYTWNSHVTPYSDYQYTNPYPRGLDPEYWYNELTMVGEFFQPKGGALGTYLPGTKSTIHFDDNEDITIYADESYDYNDRDQLIEKKLLNSDNRTIKQTFSYPEINNTGPTTEIIQKMVDENLIAPVINAETYVANTKTSGSQTAYQEFSIDGSSILKPARSYELEIKTGTSEYVLKDQVLSYSANGNPLEVKGRDEIFRNYIWGYNDQYMIAQILQRNSGAFYHTSFEEDGVAFIVENVNKAKTGSKVFDGGSFSFDGKFSPSSVQGLKMSYWYWDGAAWKYSGVVNYSSTIVTGGTKLDEIRVYMENAQMTTYTYNPLIGMTSMTDPNNITTYYEYDTFGRLKLIRNHQGEVVKTYQYNYKIKEDL